ncbi:hypothetical protein EVAR_35660_1 [Eumeta japonica]|uniref:Uncharacterized protein n=1 Tax=Eumeta variegata TaxID=151549 RepID=A0A4C1VG08_EUMVA|nr:hypothetical protein EVAR_35660_1 [Eumeta japonica]
MVDPEIMVAFLESHTKDTGDPEVRRKIKVGLAAAMPHQESPRYPKIHLPLKVYQLQKDDSNLGQQVQTD